jgi:DNA polymerase-3 subunit alpha
MYLNCHSYFSLRFGTLSIKDLVSEGYDKGTEVMALTDINNTSGVFDFYNQCNAVGIKPIIGIEFRNEDELVYVGLAKNNQGFQELNIHLSTHNAQKKPFAVSAPLFNEVYIIYPWGKKQPEELRENEFIGIRISDLTKLVASDLRKHQDKLIMFPAVTFKDKKGFNTHRLLRAIDKNTLLSRLEPESQASFEEIMLPVDQLMSLYGRYYKIISTTTRLIESCNIVFNLENKSKKTFSRDKENDKLQLEKLAMEGLIKRYGTGNKYNQALNRVIKELEIINKQNFNANFLITWDILRYAISKNFSYVGRGSGANSIVAYCLGITDVDPIDLDLYFERFLNPHRSSPPDFDIDFCWKERDEIIDYIFNKYKTKHTALLATYNTFKGKSIIRELGKVFGLPKPEIDAIINDRKSPLIKDKDHIVRMIFNYGKNIESFPNHLSIHAGGILITEEPISCYTATDLPPKGFPITHFDMFAAEEMGFYKYDILGQRGLGHIKDSIRLIHRNTGNLIEPDPEIAKKDEKVKEQLKAADTIGCFYIESPGMRMLLKKLRCQDYHTLVAASSIIRPGVAQSGMMQQYIHRFHHPDQVKYPHPKMEELLKETYGVMVYQEDVIKVAHHFAGFDLGEAGVLRRAMSGKYKGYSGFQLVKDKFFSNCKEKGYPDELAKEVWRQIESFGGYSFSKAHSASFAVESYQSLYLKSYYPLEFYTAVINNFGGFYNTEFYVHQARMHGADLQAPCVNHSEWQTTIYGKTIYLGFVHLKSLEERLGQVIAIEREVAGEFKDLIDFIKRIPLSLEQLNILIRIGAFRFTGKNKKVLLIEAALYLSETKQKPQSIELFALEPKELKLPALASFTFEDAFDQIDLLEFPLCFPFDLLPEEQKIGITFKEMLNSIGKNVSMVGYFVTSKDLYTIKNDLMSFMHFIDRNGETFDTTHFPPSLKQYPFQGRGFYLMKGKVVEEFGYPSLEVSYMEKLPMVTKEVIYESERP